MAAEKGTMTTKELRHREAPARAPVPVDNDSMRVTLRKTVVINGKVYNPGEHTMPLETFDVWRHGL